MWNLVIKLVKLSEQSLGVAAADLRRRNFCIRISTLSHTYTQTICMHVKMPINIEPTVITCAISVKHTHTRKQGKKGGGREGHEIVVGNNNEMQTKREREREREENEYAKEFVSTST